MLRADVAKVDAGEARHAAQTGASSTIAKQAKTKESKGPQEGFKLSEAAQKALDKAEQADTLQDQAKAQDTKNQSSVADDVALQGTKRRTQSDDEDDKKIGLGDVKNQKDGTRVFQLDDDGGEVYEVSETQAKDLKKADGRSPESILEGMPEASKNAAAATLDTQIKANGKEKVSELKDDPKVSQVAEQLDLDPAEGFKDGVRIAPISVQNAPLEIQTNPNDEVMAKQAAVEQMQNGGGEQMIA